MNPARADVRDLAERLVDATRDDDVDSLATLLASLVGRHAPRTELYEPVLAEFVAAVVRSLRQRVGDEGVNDANDTDGADSAERVFTVDLVDAEDNPAAVDEIDPALRAVLRAVLAQLNDDVADARFQLSLVGADPEPLSRLDALWHVLLWSMVLEGPPGGARPDLG
nr:hypothetical protein [Saccharomonospora sp.]